MSTGNINLPGPGDLGMDSKPVQEYKDLLRILQQSEELTQTGSWEYNPHTSQFTWSDGMYRLFDIARGTVITANVYPDHVIKEDRHKAEKLIAAIRESNQPQEDTFRIQTGSAIKTITIKSIPLVNVRGQVEKILGVGMDVTNVKLAEEKIQGFNELLITKNRELAALNSELKTFTSIAANDYKETLRQLYLSLEFIASNDGGNLSNSGRANVRRAQSAVQRMKLLTDDLVSYARLQEVGVWEPRVDLNAILKDVLHDFDTRSMLIDARIDCKPLPYISGYPFLISLVFHHLIENALRFKKENEPPGIQVFCRESVKGSELVYEAVRPDTTYHIITVEDAGIGISKEETEKIFGIFYRIDTGVRHKGSGIGLAICRKIMDMHQGFIIAESEPGKGSSFHCFFPYDPRDTPPL